MCLGCAALWVSDGGCRDSIPGAGHGGTLSNVYARFDPVGEFARLGCTVNEAPPEGAISATELYGWRAMQGSLELPGGAAGCDDLAAAIRSSLDQLVHAESLDDFLPLHHRQPGQLLQGVFRYTTDGMLGHVYFWLFPDPSETRINYAILLHEGRCSDARSPAKRL